MTGSSASADQAADASGTMPDASDPPPAADPAPVSEPARPVVDLVKIPGLQHRSTLPAETRASSHVAVDEPLAAWEQELLATTEAPVAEADAPAETVAEAPAEAPAAEAAAAADEAPVAEVAEAVEAAPAESTEA